MKTAVRTNSVSLVVFGSLLLSGARAGAQDRSQEPGLTFRTSVQEVNLDLIVRDSRGRQVRNLKPEDVEIYEDGVLQPVKAFRLVAGRDVQQPAAEGGQKRQKAVAAGDPKIANPLPAVNYICIVFHNLDGLTIKYALDAAQQFLDREMQPGTGVALFSLGTRLSVLHEFATNRQVLTKLATNSLGGPMPNFMRASEAVLNATPYQAVVTVSARGEATLSISGGAINPGAITGADVGTGQGSDAYRALMADQRRAFGQITGMQMWDQMNAMLDELGPLPGRKSVLLLSTGLATTGEPDLFQRLLDRANRGQISIYAVDVHGMAENSNVVAQKAQLSQVAALSATQTQISGTATRGNALVAAEKSRQDQYLAMAVNGDMQSNLRALAEGTGGFLIAETEDLRKPFQRVQEDIDTHYEAVYTPTAGVYDGRFRKIEVKLRRPELNVQSRVGYYAIPALSGPEELTLFDMIGLAALNAREEPHAFDYRSKVFQFRSTAAGTQQALSLELPASVLTASPLPGNRHRLHASVLALVKDHTGQVVDKFSQDASYDIPDDKLEAMRQSSIPFTHVIDLPAGHYTVEAAVSDRAVNRVSVRRSEFENRRSNGLAMSHVMLVQQLDPINGPANAADPFQIPVDGSHAQRVIPELSNSLTAAARPLAYFILYPDASNPEKPKLEVQLRAGGRLLSEQTADVPAPNASGGVPMVVQVAARPGDCELRVTVHQGTASATQTLGYKIDPR
jgi:VWFA-related protein